MEMNKLLKQRVINNLKFNHEEVYKLVVSNKGNQVWLNRFINLHKDLTETFIDFSKIKFIISNDKKHDLENGLMLFNLFKDQDLTTLTDERFWVTLLLTKGYEYMVKRWGLKDEKVLKYHWFYYSNQRRSITYHGIARLFWRVKVTIDPYNEKDPYHLTKFAFNKQEVVKNSMFRNFMFHENTRLGYLDGMFELSKMKKITIDDIYLATKLMTKLASASLLDSFNLFQVKKLLLSELEDYS
jgi:hypothetical protein